MISVHIFIKLNTYDNVELVNHEFVRYVTYTSIYSCTNFSILRFSHAGVHPEPLDLDKRHALPITTTETLSKFKTYSHPRSLPLRISHHLHDPRPRTAP
jgi:hypothetical protein